ncbi:hypothetical protein TSAR_003499 [Trichomalopsis sarcophagae]|uniref:Uncharacterized protein n=1 Tax=Trichomalopsis sarcophagae TaxID=543379 RepID=A0A232F577_9HYME|nr:hypothetical protein TSAR_003499 [Trichomalopsis sarcophagae]
MRLVGDGLESLRTFCGVMDFPRPIQNATFTKIRNVLFQVTSRVADKFMSEAVDQELRLRRTNSQNEICEPESVNPEAISQLSIEDLDEIYTLQTYYGNAIRAHPDSIEDMTRVIWAIFYHKASTDKNPQHMHCPPGSDSWCKYEKAVAEGTQDEDLSEEIFNEIKVVFEKLSEPELLRKCLGGKTQNANESLFSCIMFSSGWKGLLYLMSELNIKPGKNASFAAVTKDQARIKDAEKQAECNTKEAIKLRRLLRISTVDDDGAYVSVGH